MPVPAPTFISVFHRNLKSALCGALLISAAAGIGYESDYSGPFGALSGPNGLIYDSALAVLAAADHDNHWQHIFVILIDQKTLETKPWSAVPRSLEQPQLAALAGDALTLGARKVGFDIVIALDPKQIELPGAAFTNYDSGLLTLLNNHSDRLVLGAYPTILPAKSYVQSAGPLDIGVLDLQKESDGIARSVATRLRLSDGHLMLGFAQALALPPDGDFELPATSRILVAPSAALDTIPNMSAMQFETCFATAESRVKLAQWLHDRVVIIGSGINGEDMQSGPDRFFLDRKTEFKKFDPGSCGVAQSRDLAAHSSYVPGVFVQAAAVESALSPQTPVLASNKVRAAANGGLAAFVMLVFIISQRAIHSLPNRRSKLFATSLRAFFILVFMLAAFYLFVVALAAAAIRFGGVWISLGHVALLAGASSALATMAFAAKRDLALADLRLTFGRWLPKPVVDAALSPRIGEGFAGQERTISVLFADLRGFTAFCEQHRNHPREVISALNRKFSEVQIILDRYKAFLDKFEGDAVIAFWNGIEDQPDHASLALAAAIEIIESGEGSDADAQQNLSFKIGIATGVAFVGAYGSPQKMSFSAIGEPMNLAARLEGLCNQYGINLSISPMTMAEVSTLPSLQKEVQAKLAQHRFIPLNEIHVRGYKKPLLLFTIERQSAIGVLR